MKIYENAAAASDILKRGRFDDEEKAAMDHSAQILKDFLEKALAE